jgi:heptosyltransferase-1
MKILVIKPSALGDVVNGLVIVPRLRKLFPDCEIHWFVNSEYAELVETAGVDKVIRFERGAWRNFRSVFSGITNVSKISLELKKNKYDVVIDLQGLIRSGWFTFITRAPVRVGFSDARELAHLFYNVKVNVKRNETHAVDCCLETLKKLGDENPIAEWKWLGLDEKTELLRGKYNLINNGFFVFVVGSRWETKNWAADFFGKAAAMLHKKTGLRIFLTGAASENHIAEQVIKSAEENGCGESTVVSLAGKISLGELLALCRESKAVLTTDTGPMHCAVSVGAKVIALMGPTSPVRHGPYNQQKNVIAIDKECAPCYKRKCPDGKICMADISPEIVVEKILKQLND